MSKLIILSIIYYLVLTFFSYSKDLDEIKCVWDNKNNIPCLEIVGQISNSSQFSKKGINKIVISRKQIQESGASDLIDILKSYPDINITQSGPKGQQASMFMRGTGSNHTLVMINGIPINDQSTTQGAHDFGLDFIQTIQQIEIYPGSSATQFGTNAIGGAINIILTGDYENSINFASDQDTNYELSGNKTIIFDNSSLNLKIGSVKHETISARGDPSNEKDKLINYSSNINYENYLNFDTRFFNNIYLRQTKTEYDNSISNQSGYKGDNKMGAYQIGLEKLDKLSKSKYILYYNFYDREYDERGVKDTYESEVVGIKYDLSKIIRDNLSFGFGSEYKYDWGYFDNNGSYEATTKGHSDNISIFANLGWNFNDNLNLSFFSRSDKHKHTGNSMTHKFNLAKEVFGSNFGIAYMQGLRNPTLYELFGTDNFGYSGNKNLSPEKSNTLELYADLKLNNYLSSSVRGFRSNIKNNIEYINNKYQNDSDDIDLNQSGINVDISFKNKNYFIKTFSSFLSSKKEDGSDQTRRPEKNYGVKISKNISNELIGNFNFHLLYNHYGKHFDIDSINFNTVEMDSTDLIDLKIVKSFNNSEYYLKITNLLKEKYQRPHGYNQDGRIIKLGFKY